MSKLFHIKALGGKERACTMTHMPERLYVRTRIARGIGGAILKSSLKIWSGTIS